LTFSEVTLEEIFIWSKQNSSEAELGGKFCETTQFCHHIPDLYWKIVRLLWMFSDVTAEKLKIPGLRWNSQDSIITAKKEHQRCEL
jgi:hypothetical protein